MLLDIYELLRVIEKGVSVRCTVSIKIDDVGVDARGLSIYVTAPCRGTTYSYIRTLHEEELRDKSLNAVLVAAELVARFNFGYRIKAAKTGSA